MRNFPLYLCKYCRLNEDLNAFIYSRPDRQIMDRRQWTKKENPLQNLCDIKKGEWRLSEQVGKRGGERESKRGGERESKKGRERELEI